MRNQTFVFIWMVFSTFAFAQNGPRTMRVDYYHSGNASQEMFSLDRVVVEPLGWPGNLRKTIDDTNLGKYLFEVRDRKTSQMLYSRGFASIYGEWETTGEAKSLNRTFHESLRFPTPQGPVQVILKKRRSRRQSGLSHVVRRIHGCRARQIRARRSASSGHPVRDVAVQRAQGGFQRVGFVRARAGIGHFAPLDRRASGVSTRRNLRCFRFRALHSDF